MISKNKLINNCIMKNKILSGTIVMAIMCINLSAKAVVTNDSINTKLDSLVNYDGYDAESSAEAKDIKEPVHVINQEPVLIFEKDTFDLGIQKRSEVTMVEHILCKCNSNKDICIKKVDISNMYGRVNASPRIAAGTKGTILCIIDKKSLKLGEHIDKISIFTDSEASPEVSIYLKYNIIEAK